MFAVYRTLDSRRIANLLCEGTVVELDGSPGANFAQGKQFPVTASEPSGKFFLTPTARSPDMVLPVPTILDAFPKGVGLLAGIINAQRMLSPLFPEGDPQSPLADQSLLATAGTASRKM